jgi:hypothetical protein
MKQESIAALMKAIAPVIHEHVEKMAEPLRQRIKELEARPTLRYLGVWDSKKGYGAGVAVTFDGSVWIAKDIASPGSRPGDSGSPWQLAVKRGVNGKDGRP